MPPRLSQSSVSAPHSVSLKVLRLSKPSLSPSAPVPSPPSHPDLTAASLPYPTAPTSAFPLSPLLTLPPSFGAAYVGESFSCTLSANNELPPTSAIHIDRVSISAELQSPSEPDGVALQVAAPSDDGGLAAGKSRQGVIRHDLKEEGMHVLAVTVAYTETEDEEERNRTFRKLYQFAARQAVGVRTKIGEIKGTGKRRWAVEAQVENLTEGEVVVEEVKLETGRGVGCRGLNGEERRWLGRGDVEQVAFRLEESGNGEVLVEGGRWVLAQLKVDWRMGMGQDGTLRTGWLGCLKRS